MRIKVSRTNSASILSNFAAVESLFNRILICSRAYDARVYVRILTARSERLTPVADAVRVRKRHLSD